MTAAIERLRAQYQAGGSAAATAAREQGRKVVACLGASIPTELLDAAGVFSLVVAPGTGLETPNAKPYVDDELELECRLLVETVMRGDYEHCDMLVVAPSSESHLYAYRFLKELSRLGVTDSIPPIHVFDMMQARKPWIEAHSRRQFDRLRRRLEILSGHPITDASLETAIETGNRARSVRGELASQRLAGRIGGVDAFTALAAGAFMDTADHAAALAEVVAEAKEWESHGRPRLAVVSSTPLFHDQLHQICERHGVEIVAEDDWWGSCGTGIGGDASPLSTDGADEVLFQQYYRSSPTSQVPFEDRYSLTLSLAEAGDVDGVLFVVSPADGYFGWIYPDLLELIEKTAIPHNYVRAEPLFDEGATMIGRAVEDLAATSRSDRSMVESRP